MSTQKMVLQSGTIIQLDAGEHDVVIVDGRVFVELMQLPSSAVTGSPVPETPKTTKAAEKVEVVDDTKPKRGRKAKAEEVPTPEPETENETEEFTKEVDGFETPQDESTGTDEGAVGRVIPKEDYPKVAPGTLVWAKLSIEGPDGEKLWEARVENYKKGVLSLYFLEDDTSMELAPNDVIYERLDN